MISFTPDGIVDNGVVRDAHYVTACGGSLIVWEGRKWSLIDLLPEIKQAGFDPNELAQWMNDNRVQIPMGAMRELSRLLDHGY